MGRKVNDITGLRFGNLEVIRYLETKDKNAYWECKCSCGNIKNITGGNLQKINGGTKSCGCVRKQSLAKLYTGGKYITGAEFNGIKCRAKTRKLKCNISVEYIENIYEKQNFKCALTNIDIVFNSRQLNNKIIRGNASIDRIDSTKGYIIGNIQIVHKDVNRMKSDFNMEYYINICKAVARSCE